MKHKLWLFYLCTFSFLVISVQAEAGRPLNTDDTGTVPPKELEAELAYEYVDQTDEEYNTSLVLTTGLTESLDIGIAIPYQYIGTKNGEDQDGFSDISVSTKWNFLKDQESLPDATLSFAYKSDSGDDPRSLGTGRPEFALNGIITQTLEAFTVHFNAGYTFKKDFDTTENKDVLTYGLAGEWAFNEKLNLVGEFFGEHTLEGDFDDNAGSVLAGFTYQIKDTIVYDAGWTVGVSDADPDFKFTMGLTMAWGF